MWSNTTAVEPSAACFAGLALLSALIYVRSRAGTALFLLMVTAAFACQFRPESSMCLAVIGLTVLFFAGEELKRGRFYLALSLLFILIIPHLAHLYAVKDMGWGSSGPKFSFDFLEGNLKANALFYLKNVRFPVTFTVLFFLGCCWGKGRGEEWEDIPSVRENRGVILVSSFLGNLYSVLRGKLRLRRGCSLCPALIHAAGAACRKRQRIDRPAFWQAIQAYADSHRHGDYFFLSAVFTVCQGNHPGGMGGALRSSLCAGNGERGAG